MDTLIVVRPSDVDKLLDILDGEDCEIIGVESGNDVNGEYRDYTIQGEISQDTRVIIDGFALHVVHSDEEE